MFRLLALSAALPWASAFLIPSTSVEIDPDVETKAMALAGVMPQVLSSATLVKLDCASCVLEDSEQEDGSGDNALLLNFTTSGDALLLNGAPIYPTTIDFNLLRVPLIDAGTTLEALHENSSSLITSSNIRTATSYGIQSSSSGTDSAGHQASTVRISLYALNQSPISVDEVHINLLELSPDHSLHVQSVTTSPTLNTPSDPNPGNPTTGDAAYKDCAALPAFLCKWRSIFAHKLSALRSGSPFRTGCHGKRPATAGMTELKGADNEELNSNTEAVHLPTHIKGIPPSNRFGSHGHPNGQHHHRHHGLHNFLHAFLRAFVGVLIPVLVGIIAGMAASIVGMALGQFAAFVYTRLRGARTSAPIYMVVEQEDEDAAERGSLDSEPLPVYQEAEAMAVEKGEAPPEYRDVAAAEEGKGNDE